MCVFVKFKLKKTTNKIKTVKKQLTNATECFNQNLLNIKLLS